MTEETIAPKQQEKEQPQPQSLEQKMIARLELLKKAQKHDSVTLNKLMSAIDELKHHLIVRAGRIAELEEMLAPIKPGETKSPIDE